MAILICSASNLLIVRVMCEAMAPAINIDNHIGQMIYSGCKNRVNVKSHRGLIIPAAKIQKCERTNAEC